MSGRIHIEPSQGEIELETVQKLIAELTNSDLMILPKLPGRVIMPDGNALAKSSDGSRYYQIVKEGDSWRCGCKAGEYGRLCKHVKGLVSYLERTTANSTSQHIGEDLATYRQRESARILAEDEEKLRAYRAKIAAIDRQATAKRQHRYHTSAPAPMATAGASLIDTSGFRPCLE